MNNIGEVLSCAGMFVGRTKTKALLRQALSGTCVAIRAASSANRSGGPTIQARTSLEVSDAGSCKRDSGQAARVKVFA
jgi:hypothetical protein